MGSPYNIVICKTCKLAIYPPSDRGPFYAAFEQFLVEYHTKQGHDCDSWLSEMLNTYPNDGKLYSDGGYNGDDVLIEDWYAYGQWSFETDWRNWPKRNKATEKYLLANGLIESDGQPVNTLEVE